MDNLPRRTSLISGPRQQAARGQVLFEVALWLPVLFLTAYVLFRWNALSKAAVRLPLSAGRVADAVSMGTPPARAWAAEHLRPQGSALHFSVNRRPTLRWRRYAGISTETSPPYLFCISAMTGTGPRSFSGWTLPPIGISARACRLGQPSVPEECS